MGGQPPRGAAQDARFFTRQSGGQSAFSEPRENGNGGGFCAPSAWQLPRLDDRHIARSGKMTAAQQEAWAAEAAVARRGRSALAWEVLRRDPLYRAAFASLPPTSDPNRDVDPDFTTRWGLHFRRRSRAKLRLRDAILVGVVRSTRTRRKSFATEGRGFAPLRRTIPEHINRARTGWRTSVSRLGQ